MKVTDLSNDERTAFNVRAEALIAEHILTRQSEGLDKLREHPELVHILGPACGEAGRQQFRRLVRRVRNKAAGRAAQHPDERASATNVWSVDMARAAGIIPAANATTRTRLGRTAVDWEADAQRMQRDAQAAWMQSTAPDPGGPLGFLITDPQLFQFAQKTRKEASELSMKADTRALDTQNRAGVFDEILSAASEEVSDSEERKRFLTRLTSILDSDAGNLGRGA
jgi:hypothetical protein